MLSKFQSWIFYIHLLATLCHFLGLTYWHSAQCQLLFLLVFLLRRILVPNGLQMQQNFLKNFYGPEGTTWAKEVLEGCPEGGTTHLGTPGGPGAPWWVVPTSGLPSGTSFAHLVSSGPTKFSKKFRCVWTPFGTDILRSKKQAKNSNWHWALCQ